MNTHPVSRPSAAPLLPFDADVFAVLHNMTGFFRTRGVSTSFVVNRLRRAGRAVSKADVEHSLVRLVGDRRVARCIVTEAGPRWKEANRG